MPQLYIITGSNGAGKSTVGSSYFPKEAGEFFDGDKLYLQKRSKLWKSGIKSQKELLNQAAAYVEQTFNELVKQAIERQSNSHTKAISPEKRAGMSHRDLKH